MSGKEIRAWAMEHVVGNRLFLIMIIMLAAVPQWITKQIATLRGQAMPLALRIPLTLLTCMLILGVSAITLELAGGGQRQFSLMRSPFQNGRLGKALTIAGVDTALRLLPLSPLGAIAIDVLRWTLLFPLGYLLFLAPERSLSALWRDGLSVGWHRIKELFCFNFILELPRLAATLLLLGLSVWMAHNASGSLTMLLLVILTVFLYWMLPYIELARAKKAREMFCPPEEALAEREE